MSESLRWRLYRAALSPPIHSGEMTWEAAPSTDVVAVVWQNDRMDKPQVELGAPYYFMHDDWITRAWDPTLYLRKLGTVKFGRFTSRDEFWAAWKAAVRSIAKTDEQYEALDVTNKNGGQVVVTEDADLAQPRPAWWVYYEGGRLYSANEHQWREVPSDGILAACYRTVVDGIALTIAKRRFTYYYWTGRELANTEDLEHVLSLHPQFKRGRTGFDGLKGYLPMAEALAAALADRLEGVPAR